MTVRLILLKTGENIISNIKEVVSKKEEKLEAYVLYNPHVVTTRSKVLLSENEDALYEKNKDYEIDVVLSPWNILSKNKDFIISKDWVVTISDPISSVKEMYIDKINSTLNIEEKE